MEETVRNYTQESIDRRTEKNCGNYVDLPSLYAAVKTRIEQSKTYLEVSRIVGVSESTVARIVKNEYNVIPPKPPKKPSKGIEHSRYGSPSAHKLNLLWIIPASTVNIRMGSPINMGERLHADLL